MKLLALLCILQAGSTGSLPPHWKPFCRARPAPKNLQPQEAGLCLVDTTGRYFYVRGTQVNLRTGTLRSYGVYRRFPQRVPTLFGIYYANAYPTGWEECVYYLQYARGTIIGARVISSSIHGYREGGQVIGTIGGKAHPRTQGIRPFLAAGYDFLVPGRLVPIAKEMTPPLGQQYLLHGSKGAFVRIPQRKGSLYAITGGIQWSKRYAYLHDFKFMIQDILRLDIRGHSGRLSVVPPPDRRYYQFVLGGTTMALRDGSLYRQGHAGTYGSNIKEMNKPFGTIVYEPNTRRWRYCDGLIVYGISTDGKYVAYSQFPWKTFQVAVVRD